MLAIDLVKDRQTREPAPDAVEKILYKAFEKGLILLGCGASSIRMATPLTVTESEIDRGLGILDEVLKTL